MSTSSDSTHSNLNLYEEEALNDETICDCSSRGLQIAPELKNKLICVLYLQNNRIKTLPDYFFPSLPALMWLDLRGNELTDLPTTIKNHEHLTHLLLQNNKLTSLPLELGSVTNLKVLQLSGNPLMFPPREVISAGVSKVKPYLQDKYIENIFVRSQSDFSEDAESAISGHYKENNQEELSYNSVLDEEKLKTAPKLTIEMNEKESDDSDEEYFAKIKGKCPKLAKSRHKTLPTYYQSAKYIKSENTDSLESSQMEKIKQKWLRDLALKKHKNLLATRDKILQERKTMEHLSNWRSNYRCLKQSTDGSYRMKRQNYPYDTNPEFMTLLTREDIEKDLPDKYKKKLVRKSKPTVPRKSNNDVHLALKIKQLFENLEAIDLNREGLTPRTEQRVLMNEIQKISEIKQKLLELSSTNVKSVSD